MMLKYSQIPKHRLAGTTVTSSELGQSWELIYLRTDNDLFSSTTLSLYIYFLKFSRGRKATGTCSRVLWPVSALSLTYRHLTSSGHRARVGRCSQNKNIITGNFVKF